MASVSDLSLLYPKFDSNVMSAAERTGANLLVVDSESNIRSSMRTALVSAGYSSITDATSHGAALQKIQDGKFTHVIFEAKRSSMPVQEFLARALESKEQIILIPSSYEPTVDEVFSLLLFGARGYIVKPFTSGSVDESIVMASKGEPISDSVVSARTTNEALALITLKALNRLSVTIKQAQNFETARREIPKRLLSVRRAVELGRTFAQGGEVVFRDALIEACIERAENPGARIGQVRRRADEKRAAIKPVEIAAPLEVDETEIAIVDDLLQEQDAGL